MIQLQSTEIRGMFYFDPEDLIYKEHFPGNAVVPGSLILHAFITAATNAGLIKGRCRVEGFRFNKFISPGKYAYTIQTWDNRMECRLLEEERICAAGIIAI